MAHFSDRLFEQVKAKGTPLCVGLDPRWDSLPEEIRERCSDDSLENRAQAFEEFCTRVLDVVADSVAVVKPQSAFFERCGPVGMTVLQRLLKHARDRGLITILDSKRNDIASTAQAYAEAAFEVWGADSLTVSPYLGRDSIEPFLEAARKVQGGVFVLVRTSNPGAGQFQDLAIKGEELYETGPLFLKVAEAVQEWTTENLGECGFGDVGAVVGATWPEEMAQLRAHIGAVPFLVPGFGAQGGDASDVAGAFRPDGLGAVVNSSRGILFPYSPEEKDWEKKIEQATKQANEALQF